MLDLFILEFRPGLTYNPVDVILNSVAGAAMYLAVVAGPPLLIRRLWISWVLLTGVSGLVLIVWFLLWIQVLQWGWPING